jgi:CheY-like chemotaxis protein
VVLTEEPANFFAKSYTMSHKNNVFLIDDDETVNFINTKIMEKADFAQEIKTFQSGLSALAQLRQLRATNPEKFPDMIFLDLSMPGMNGWEFLDNIVDSSDSLLKDCKLFILTSSIDEHDIERAKKYKMVSDFISKPLTPERFESISVEPHSTTKKE